MHKNARDLKIVESTTENIDTDIKDFGANEERIFMPNFKGTRRKTLFKTRTVESGVIETTLPQKIS